MRAGAAPEIASPDSAATLDSPETAGERRQLTVLFCDLVGSTALGQQLDPEALSALISDYQDVCQRAVVKLSGHIAQYLGDGVLVYFGYPAAYEDAAERAVRAGLAIRDELARRQIPGASDGASLQARIGIHTGEVVISEIGSGQRAERLALGGTPNIAARLQAIAEPGTIVISDATLRLVSGIFVIADLGVPTLKGVDQKPHVYRVDRGAGVPDRLGAATSLTTLVGRESQLASLRASWQRCVAGEGQVVILRAEAGLGKSRLVRAFRETIADTPHILLSCQCSSYSSGSGFEPLIRLIRGELDFAAADDPVLLLASALEFPRLDLDAVLPFLAQLLGLPPSAHYPLLAMGPELQRMKTLEALCAIPECVSALQPLVYVFEDLHWADPSTLAYLELLIDRLTSRRIMLILTQRPDTETPPAFLRRCTTAIELDRLSPEQSAGLVESAAGRELPADLVRKIVARAQGIPLYAEELTRSVIDAGILEDREGQLGLATTIYALAIPPTLQDSLMARLDRLSSSKAIAQIGATLGSEFDYPLLEAVSGLGASRLRTALEQLVEHDVLQKFGEFPDARFVFAHSLMHDVAYRAQLIATRRALHGRIVEVVEAQFPQRAQAHPDWMLVHTSRAELPERGVHYAELAGNTARDRLAHEEAAVYFQTAIEQLHALPASEQRDAREVTLELAHGGALALARGYSSPEARATYARVRELNDRLTPGPAQLAGWVGIGQYATMTATFPELLEAGQHVLRIAEPLPLPTLHALGHLLCGIGLTTSDTPQAAIEHLEEAARIASDNPIPPPTLNDPDLEVAARSTLLIAYQSVGEIEKWLSHEELCLRRARSLDHAATLALALTMASAAANVARDPERSLRLSAEAHALARDRGFVAWRWQNALRLAWARLATGESEAIVELREAWIGINDAGASSTDGAQRLFYALGLVEAGEYEEALAECDTAEKLVVATGEQGLLGEVGRHRSYVLYRKGDFDAALSEAKRVIHDRVGLCLGNLDLARCLAQELFERGDSVQARELLEPAMRLVHGGDVLGVVQRAKQLLARLDAA